MYPYGIGSHSRISIFLALPLVLFSSLLSAQSGPSQCLAAEDYMRMLHADGTSVWAGEDFGCFVNIEEVETGSSLIVDIRQAREYGRVRIPGSINISPAELLHSPSLKGRHLIVMDKGFSRSTLAELCSAARKSGFLNLTIPNGGLSSWFASGRPLTGLPGDRDRLFSITPEMLFTEAAQSTVSVLAPHSQAKQLAKIFPPNVLVLAVGEDESLEGALVSLLSQSLEGRTAPVVLVGFDPSALEIAKQHRSVFLIDQSANQIARAFQKTQDLARSRLDVPERYRCRG